MKACLRVGVLVLVAVAALGSGGCGVGTTANENWRTFQRVSDYDARMLGDDVRLLTETQRPWRGSRYALP
ncbi:MAG: hypothetical protein U1A27_07180 [Phycisphaerae bacterium]